VGDYDNDGDLDFYATAFGPNTLYRNNGDGTFTDVTAAAGVAGGDFDWSTSTGFFDYDNDGDLDLYVANYLEYRNFTDPWCGFKKPGYRMYCNPTNFDAQADRLFRNNGDGTFTDVSREAGIANPAGKGLGVAVCDFDRDGFPDIYVANDMVRNFLYRNLGDGAFQDVSYGAGVGFDGDGMPQAGMGAHCRDFDGDGWPDLWVTNYSDELNTLYRNMGEGLLFEDVSAGVGLLSSHLPLGFGTRLFDYDNDGDLDIYVTNGHVVDNVELYRPDLSYAQKDLLYENDGNGRFRDISEQSGPAFQIKRVGRGLAMADYDNDGDLDIAILNQGQPATLLRNEVGAGNNWITIRAVGKRDNRFGMGAKVRIQAGGKRQTGEIDNVGSYQSAHDVRLHFGLGAAKTIDEITVEWPDGTTQALNDVAVNQFLTIEQP
ncbi:MAG: CRTAC1 family protein, partial [Sedimentisphaerales bacterium]|nr:CRTAC1 family protein [Sedimentisphaerales bacterium]